ncbi:MAG TPA: malto-oligosyltrehalose trehalohydrolase [Chitinophaga sp.]|uniref:malto-oligosyltrehalose trehalohydrolase n=1 Tax=Chitinophaga sp. TaxID=1869181 RepID=UPI002DBD68E9|nr:malto-oligosyltrehalose trehalohydrolase [Chitinophaga sp.]HEU4552901.1 malto-oligosyltrehalose trehalohydrolase [Chitinophaga sp.]
MEKPGVYAAADHSTFTVWAPLHKKMDLHLLTPEDKIMPMQQGDDGYFTLTLPGLAAGCRYFYRPGGDKDYPDPASHYQPEGVHGPSATVDHNTYSWNDHEWKGLPMKSLVFYELHVGTFTPEGTFEAIIPRLDDLAATGINAIELMPVTQFPGTRNWGYDTVYPYAVQHSYGGPQGLKRLIDACHQKGIAVFLDVICNHLGPEGNYLAQFAPYFSDKYKTPWGSAVNFDGPYSDGVRHYFLNNMVYWFTHYHVDGLRQDAIHEVYDRSATHFWQLMHSTRQQLEEQLGRRLYLVAESDLNSPHVVKQPDAGGWGFDAQWLDDFHHALYVLLDEKGKKHYTDFGKAEQLCKAFKEGFVHSGDYVEARKRRHGASSAGIGGEHFIVFSQNHDLVGNRPQGERLAALVNTPRLKLAAAAVLLSSYIPLLFMGEEYAAATPFYFFADFQDEDIIKALREGREKDFSSFEWDAPPPDAMSENVFRQCVLQWQEREQPMHRDILLWYKELIALRREHPLLQNFDKNNLQVTTIGPLTLLLHRYDDASKDHLLCYFNFSTDTVSYTLPEYAAHWHALLDSNGPVQAQATLRAGQSRVLGPLSVYLLQSNSERG